MGRIGTIKECSGEVTFEWEIEGFSILSDKLNSCYESPQFYCFGASWMIWIFPNGRTEHDSGKWIGIYIVRMSNGYPLTLNLSYGLKNDDEKIDPIISYTDVVFDKKYRAWGNSRSISRSKLLDKRSDITSSDILTVVCILKKTESHCTAGSFINRLQDVSDNLKEIYLKGWRADTLLNVEGENILAHRIILETRSPAMLNYATNAITGEIYVNDTDIDTMHALLQHVYSGEIHELTRENALPLYAASEKCELDDVKEMCSEFIVNNLAIDWICDVIKFAEFYKDDYMIHYCKEYFKENADKILKTDDWMKFSKENQNLGLEFLTIAMETLLSND